MIDIELENDGFAGWPREGYGVEGFSLNDDGSITFQCFYDTLRISTSAGFEATYFLTDAQKQDLREWLG